MRAELEERSVWYFGIYWRWMKHDYAPKCYYSLLQTISINYTRVIGNDSPHLEALLSFKTSSYFSVEMERESEREMWVKINLQAQVSLPRKMSSMHRNQTQFFTGEDGNREGNICFITGWMWHQRGLGARPPDTGHLPGLTLLLSWALVWRSTPTYHIMSKFFKRCSVVLNDPRLQLA